MGPHRGHSWGVAGITSDRCGQLVVVGKLWAALWMVLSTCGRVFVSCSGAIYPSTMRDHTCARHRGQPRREIDETAQLCDNGSIDANVWYVHRAMLGSRVCLANLLKGLAVDDFTCTSHVVRFHGSSRRDVGGPQGHVTGCPDSCRTMA